MAQRRISTIVMAVLGVLLLVGLFLPYLQSSRPPEVSASVFDVVGGDPGQLVPTESKVIYTVIAAVVGLGGLMALLSLTSKKVFGIFSIILSLVIAAFQGLLSGAFTEERSVVPGIGFWLLLVISAALCVASFVFVLRKPRPRLAA